MLSLYQKKSLHDLCRVNDTKNIKELYLDKSYENCPWEYLNIEDDAGNTPLMVAVKYAKFEAIKALLGGYQESTVFVDVKDGNGMCLIDSIGINTQISGEIKKETSRT